MAKDEGSPKISINAEEAKEMVNEGIDKSMEDVFEAIKEVSNAGENSLYGVLLTEVQADRLEDLNYVVTGTGDNTGDGLSDYDIEW